MAVKKRIYAFIESKGIPVKRFEELCGLSNGYISSMRKGFGKDKLNNVLSVFPELNRDWLIYGEGEMLKSTGNTVSVGTANSSTVVGGNYYGGMVAAPHTTEVPYAEQVPVVPATIAKQPELDTITYLRNNMESVEISSVRVDDTKLTLWLPMPDESMSPEICKGDRLGLWAYPKGNENPIPGKIYAVDTCSNGFIVRYLFITPNGDYLMRSKNPEMFPDFIIKKDDVIAVYKKMIMVRI